MSDRPISADSWHGRQVLNRAPGMHVLADTLADLVDQGRPIVVGTADLKYSNGLVRFQQRHPSRFVQFGISEQNMVSAAAGMATTGVMPYVATFASFLALLCCEQIRTDVAYSALPVRLIGHHSGFLLGFYGTSHHATEDLAIMRSIADLTVVAPADAAQLSAAITASVDYPQPIYFRIGRGQEPDVYRKGEEPFQFGRAIVHDIGDDLTIIATGSMVHPSLDARRALQDQGVSVGLIDMHTVKPLDTMAVNNAAARSRALMTVEEHNTTGGLGSAVAEVLSERGRHPPLYRHGINDTYAIIGPPTHLYRYYDLDSEGIAKRALKFLEQAKASS